MGGMVEVYSLTTEEGATRLLARELSPATVRAVALRAEELRFVDPPAAVGVARAALAALSKLHPRQRRPRLVAMTWSIFGSACRAIAEFDIAEFALLYAAETLPPAALRSRAEVLRRLAYLRADQRRKEEACGLMATVVAFWRPRGGLELGKRLSSSAAILIRFGEYARAAADAEEALTLLPSNGDRFHLSTVYNLATARLEISSTQAELMAVAGWVAEAVQYAEVGTFAELRAHWLTGKLMRRLGRFSEAVAALERAREGIDQRSNGFERALLLVDLAETHLAAGDPESARHEALSSFSVLQALRSEPDAYKALQLLHHAAADLALDQAAVRTVRAALLASRR